ncbi:MAG: hypothetical protein JW993_06640 [Sedimentisphaerales bacterium]|nr:hypothetical protein [Sedimentisphaerales bacterium]
MTLVVIAVSSAGRPVWAQPDVNVPGTGMQGTQPTPAMAAGFVGEITGNDVFIRSGPATNYYQCGKLYKGDTVQVVQTQDGWSCIVPPPGCFSWIAMQYVSINLSNPTMGIVTGDNVGVYAGSDFVQPMYSSSKQVTLKRGQTVRLLNEEKDEYYKIAPPQGAYLWVSSQYVEPAQSAQEPTPVEVEPAQGTSAPTPGTSTSPASESELLDAYYALSKLVKEEQQKPTADQNYAPIKEQLAKLAANQAAGRAARYAEFTLAQVERYELAGIVAKEIALQKKELANITDKIDEARAARLAQIENMGRFAVIGKLESSSLYASTTPAGQAQRYRILDGSDKTICYVSPTGPAVGKDVSKLIGKKVGLVGDIRPHPATGRAFVEFTDIVPLEE